MKQESLLKKQLMPGKVYRRADLATRTTNVDRHLRTLVDKGELVKLQNGLYLHPKETAFGRAPADDDTLVRTFLKDNNYLLTSLNAYNSLGVGTTQLYNQQVVYNKKRHGVFNLGGRTFDFRRKPDFPRKLTPEFLLVDLLNNMKYVAEDHEALRARVREKALEMDVKKLATTAKKYGKVSTQKFFNDLLDHAS